LPTWESAFLGELGPSGSLFSPPQLMPRRGTTEDEKFTLCPSASAWGMGTHPGLKRRGMGGTAHGIVIFTAGGNPEPGRGAWIVGASPTMTLGLDVKLYG